MAQLLNFTDGDRLYVTYLEAMSQAIRGYSVKSGCDITPISGMNIALASGYVTLKGKDVAISSDTITIEASETDKDRVDVIVYNTDLDTVTTLKGTTWVTQDTISYPKAVSIQDTQIPIALIYVREDTTEILSTDITNINLKNFYNDTFESNTILPYETGTQNLGSATKEWNELYVGNIYSSSYYQYISKTSGVINTTYDEKVYFFIPSFATTVEMLVIGRKPSSTVQTHSHGPHKHTIGVSDTRAVSGGYLHSAGGVVGAINVSSPGNAPNVVQNTTIGSGTPPATVAFPNGLTLRVNGTPTHGPYGDGSADYIGTWIDITSEITVDSVNYLEFLATTAGCIADIEIRYK